MDSSLKQKRAKYHERVFSQRLVFAEFSLNYILQLLNIVRKGALRSLNPDPPALNDIKESNTFGLSSSQLLLIRRYMGFHNFLTPDRIGRNDRRT
jgi:hypothetical protein